MLLYSMIRLWELDMQVQRSQACQLEMMILYIRVVYLPLELVIRVKVVDCLLVDVIHQ